MRPPLPPATWTRTFTPPRIIPATVFGELTADDKHIVITLSGDEWPCRRAREALLEMTPQDSPIAGGIATLMPLTWPTYMQLACTFGQQFSPGGRLREWFMMELARRTQWADRELRYQLPPGLALKEWQPEAVKNVAHTGCLLEDQPRLGKTVEAIVGLAERTCWPEYPPVLPIVVVCPASVVTAWVREFQKWAPHWRTVAWRGGNQTIRHELIGHYDVYVTSYATARRDARHNRPALRDSPLAKIKAHTVVADEYHFCANDKALQTLATQRLAREANKRNGLFIPLSGTPFTHNISNAQPTWEVFEPGAFPSKERMVDRWLVEEKQDYGQKITGLNKQKEAEFRACFLGRQLRRSREDVAPWLSAKTYSTREIPIPAPYEKMYRDMEKKMIAELDNGDEVTVMSTLTKMMRLQQMAASACDLSVTYTVDEETGLDVEHQHLHPKLPSWKIDAMLDVLAELEWPALVFGISKPLMILAGQEAERQGARVGYVVGGQRQKDRDQDIDNFQAGKLDLLSVVVQAGGTGLTLNAAGSAIFLQRPCSFVHSLQAEDRGIGDRYPTLDVVDIFAEGSVDYRIRDILHEKAAHLSEYFNDPRIVRRLFGGGELKTAA